jgi:hypothetical protein
MTPYDQVKDIMQTFAIDTHLYAGETIPVAQPRRYLWTDAFAVCNYLSLYRQSNAPVFLQQALQLVSQVHEILGKHRKDSAQTGWLSGLDDEQAQLHPTAGGLRIGKALDERSQDSPVNESLEWQQDGQYFHYLTKWMHALNCVSGATGDAIYTQWAIELAKVAHSAFVYAPATGGAKRMYWKMSIDLSRPLVGSMGQHDPLDGLLTYLQLQKSARQHPDISAKYQLDTEISEMFTICKNLSLISHDALGTGGLLTDAYKLMQLSDKQHPTQYIELADLLAAIEKSLQIFVIHSPLQQHAQHRLAFRELGLSIGLQTIHKMQQWLEHNPGYFAQQSLLEGRLAKLSVFERIHTNIENFWLNPEHHIQASWQDHIDINSVMLATSLMPDSYLQLDWHS